MTETVITTALLEDHAEAVPAMLFADGGWTALDPDPVASLEVASSDWRKASKAAGFLDWFTTAGRNGNGEGQTPLTITVYRRAASPRFLVELDAIFEFEWVYASSLPDVMRLLADWAPVVQAIAVTELIDSLENKDDPGKSFAALARAALQANHG